MFGLVSVRGASRWVLLPLDGARLAVSPCFQGYADLTNVI